MSGMESVRVLLSDSEFGDVYALLTVVDDVPYIAPMGSEPFGVAHVGVWNRADVSVVPISR
jgi:hypothetical protein